MCSQSSSHTIKQSHNQAVTQAVTQIKQSHNQSTHSLCKFARTCTPQCPSKARIICPPLPASRKSICRMREGVAM